MPLVGGAMSSSGKDDWVTPIEVWAFGVNVLGTDHFDLDAAALLKTRQAPEYFGPDHVDPARRDALTISWAGYENVWCNPPYSREGGGLARWCKKFYEASLGGSNVMALFFARTETAAWHDYVSKASNVWFIRGRLSFYDPETMQPRFPAPAPSCLVLWKPGFSGETKYRNVKL